MGLFDRMGNQGQQAQRREIGMDQMRTELGSIKANPYAYLQGKGFNIPDGMTDAKQITRYLLQSGQVGGDRVQKIMRMLGMPGR